MHDIHQLLKQYWGYSTFRPLQEDIVRAALSGKDALALLPTGGGKSVCFQVPALAMEGVCIVVSPLIALMKDQVEQLKRRGIKAVAIYSGMSAREIDIALDNCVFGQVKFLYVSPERLKTEIMQARTKRMKVCLLAIDEAHCISQWGYDFRPPYLEIAQFRELLPKVPCLALTATATERVKADIMEKLQFPRPLVFQKSFERPNLSYSVLMEEHKEGRLVAMLRKVPGSAVVYVRSRKRAQVISEWLQRHHISADYYHAGLEGEVRSRKQDEWIANKIRVMVATNAFGMGIDKPDVRLVVHVDIPESLEAYYQEAGRAGRDEKLAYASVLLHPADAEALRKKVKQAYPPIEQIKRVYQAVANYYKLAVGSGLMASFDFDMEAFAKTYSLEVPLVYHSLKRLEEQGFLQLNEAFFMPSRLLFKVDKARLYEYQIMHPNLEPLIKALLRVYGGELFTDFLQIGERRVANLINLSEEQVRKQLQYLHQHEIVAYVPQNDAPQLTFTTERLSTASFPFNKQWFEDRMKTDLDKVEAVIHYMYHQSQCRTQLLLAYFGEILDRNCGACDHCLREKRAKKRNQGIAEQIEEALRAAPISPEALLQQFDALAKEEATATIRAMLDSGEIMMLDDGKLLLAEG